MLTWKRFGVSCCAWLALLAAPDRSAVACGGCFHTQQPSQSRSTQVVGHRMALSVSNTQTTLWDQIQYVGDPAEFAWVLPIRGPVEVGVSSDALFAQLDALTRVTIDSGIAYCTGPGAVGSGPDCNATSADSGGGTMVDAVEADPVEIIAQQVVGPYETVQLSSADPLALRTWLMDHGYDVPADVAPIVDAYVAEGFDFLAIRLIPGVGVTSMRPIRVTTPGPTLTLPLRMVSAGTGAMTAISLFIVSEGMYVPSSAPWAQIDPYDLVWDFDAGRSNYAELRQQYFLSTQSTGWLAEAYHPLDLCGEYGTGGGGGAGGSDGAASAASGCACNMGAPSAPVDGVLVAFGLGWVATRRRRPRRSRDV